MKKIWGMNMLKYWIQCFCIKAAKYKIMLTLDGDGQFHILHSVIYKFYRTRVCYCYWENWKCSAKIRKNFGQNIIFLLSGSHTVE